MPKELKKFDDTEAQIRIEQFVKLGLKDRDNIDFDFEADLIKLIKKLNVARLINNDKEYLKQFTQMIIRMYEKIYLKDVVKAGRQQGNRFVRLFARSKNAS